MSITKRGCSRSEYRLQNSHRPLRFAKGSAQTPGLDSWQSLPPGSERIGLATSPPLGGGAEFRFEVLGAGTIAGADGRSPANWLCRGFALSRELGSESPPRVWTVASIKAPSMGVRTQFPVPWRQLSVSCKGLARNQLRNQLPQPTSAAVVRLPDSPDRPAPGSNRPRCPPARRRRGGSRPGRRARSGRWCHRGMQWPRRPGETSGRRR